MIRYLSYNKSLLGIQETNVCHCSKECLVFGIHIPLLVVHKPYLVYNKVYIIYCPSERSLPRYTSTLEYIELIVK